MSFLFQKKTSLESKKIQDIVYYFKSLNSRYKRRWINENFLIEEGAMFAEYKYLSSLSEVNINKLIEMVKSDKSLSLHNRDFLLTSLRGSFNTAEKYLQAQYEKNRYDYESISQTFKDLHQRPKLLSSFNKTSLLIATGSLISACILLEEYNFVKNCPLIQLEKKKLSKDKDSKQ